MPELRVRICERTLCLDAESAATPTPDLLSPAQRCVFRAPTFALGYDARTPTFAGVESLIRKAL